VRHPVVQKIVMAYEAFEEKKQQALEAEKQAAKLASKEAAQAAANTSKD
jgi:phosphate starvation-inducible protein PhoH and related proteins